MRPERAVEAQVGVLGVHGPRQSALWGLPASPPCQGWPPELPDGEQAVCPATQPCGDYGSSHLALWLRVNSRSHLTC